MAIKNIYLLFPLFAALSWGMLYAINGRVYEFVSVPTNFMVFALSCVLGALLLAFIYKTPIDFTPYFSHPQRIWAWLVLPASMAGTIFLHLAIKNVSASYGALGEIGYVFLTPLFAWLLFNQKHLNGTMLLGAGFIAVGLYFVFSGQMQKTP